MDEDRKSEILSALAQRHGVDKESPAIAEEWQHWSGENQHLAGASLGDAVRSFVSHLTKRGIISTTTASTEARVPSEAHRRHLSNAATAHQVAIAGDDYEDDYDGGEDMAGRDPLDGGEAENADDEDLASLLAPESIDDFALQDHVTLDERMRGATSLRSGGELLGGDGEDDYDYDDPDYGDHGGALALAGDGAPMGDGDGGDIDAIMREIYDLDLDAAGGELLGDDEEIGDLGGVEDEELEMVGAHTRFLNRSRFVAHTRMSAKLSMLVNFAARHRVVDPESERGMDTLEKMHSQGMDVGSDVARAVARYIARRPGTDTDRQKDHLRALPAALVAHWIAALGWIDSRTRGEAEKALRYLRDTLTDFRSQIFQTPEMERQYAQRTTLGGGPTQIVNAGVMETLGKGATALGKGATALGGGVLYGTKKAYTGTVRGARKLKSMGRAGLNSKQRASVAALVLAFVQQGKIAAGAIRGHGSARRVDEHIRASALLLKTKARGRAVGTATSLIELLVGLAHGYVTDERFAVHQVRLVDDALGAIDAAVRKRQLVLAEGSAEGALERAGAPLLLETTQYDREGAVVARTDHGAADAGGEFATRLVGAAAAYLRQNPSCVKKAGAEFALLVPADPQTVRAVGEKLASEDAEARKRYLQNALLARHPNADLDARGHLLSLSGRPYRSQRAGARAGATLELQRMRRQERASRHEDAWDTELRNAGGALTPHANHRAMHCAAPKTAGEGVYTVHASAHPDSQAIRIRPLHFRVAPQ